MSGAYPVEFVSDPAGPPSDAINQRLDGAWVGFAVEQMGPGRGWQKLRSGESFFRQV
jgi:hypothetical protein